MSVAHEDGIATVWCEECEKVRVVTSKEERPVPKEARLPKYAAPYEGELVCGHRARWIGAREED